MCKLLKKDRQDSLIEYIKRKKNVSVTELSKNLFVSEATVRRDLAELENRGVVGRTHGGAFLPEGTGAENPAKVREKLQVNAKRKMAELAKDFIKADMTVFMDSSSSAGMVIPYIAAAGGISVITNGIRNSFQLMEKGGAKVYLCGGLVSRYSDAALGAETVEFLSRFRADLCIISCGGIITDGVTEASPEQADIKRRMLKNSKVRLALCDSSKMGKSCMSLISDFSDIDFIITDCVPDKRIQEAVLRNGCEIICTEEDK